MTETARRDFLKLAFAGALAAAGAALQSAKAAGRAAEPASAVRSRQRRRCGARPRQGRLQAAEDLAARAVSVVDLRPVRGDPSDAGLGDLERRPHPLRARAAASRLRLHYAGRPLPCRERSGSDASSSTAASSISARSTSRLSFPTSASPACAFQRRRRRSVARRRDFPGRQLLPLAGSRPDLRPDRARPFDPQRRPARRRIPVFPRAVDRKAEPGRRHARHPRAARFDEPLRRLPLHVAHRRSDDHRHRAHAVCARRSRPPRARLDGGGLSLRLPRPPAFRRRQAKRP